MNNKKNSPHTTANNSKEEPKYDLICVGLDSHASSTTAVHSINNCVPRAARKYQRHEKLFNWLGELKSQCTRLVVCIEAGPCGFWMARTILSMGIECLVVAPKKWSENGKVKTDARDAHVLCERLYQWVMGRSSVFTIVMIPTVEQEDKRQFGRMRKRFYKQHKQVASAGRGIGLQSGHRLKGCWWEDHNWEKLPEGLCEILEYYRDTLIHLEIQIAKLDTKLKSFSEQKEQLPSGLGELTDGSLNCEIMDWERFNNRRQVGGFIGLVPGESSSGPNTQSLPITKEGSGEVRRLLVQAAWRMIRFQPDWWVTKKWKAKLDQAPKWQRKKIIIGIARQLMIDLWRLKTGQTTLEKLGLRTVGT